jgi:TusA-related sulfurtransferase
VPDELRPDAVCDGGDLDCGSGLLLILRNALAALRSGQLLEVKSREQSVAVDLPAWCRLVGHELAGVRPGEQGSHSYFLRKRAPADERLPADLERARAYRWSVRARAKEGLRARVYVRNHAVTIGQPASFDTEDQAPSAIEMLLAALASCLAVGFRWRASRAGVELGELEVVLGARAENILVFLGIPGESGRPGLERIEGRLFVDSPASDAELDRLWRETLAVSPLYDTLARGVPLSIERKSS